MESLSPSSDKFFSKEEDIIRAICPNLVENKVIGKHMTVLDALGLCRKEAFNQNLQGSHVEALRVAWNLIEAGCRRSDAKYNSAILQVLEDNSVSRTQFDVQLQTMQDILYNIDHAMNLHYRSGI